jgi:agmatinase
MSQINGFLGLPPQMSAPEGSRVHVLPIPYEATVSYEGGTRLGPRAIIEASQQVELFDAELGGEPALGYGVHTLPELSQDPDAQAMMRRISDAAEAVARARKLLLVLGGEHSITPAVVRGVGRTLSEPLVVVQLDAHADLRESYSGTGYSHACAMRRVLEENVERAVQIGIRSYSLEEAAFIKENPRRVSLFTAEVIHGMEPTRLEGEITRAVKGKKVYLTIDVDGLDPSVIPATGTPEPDGLSWAEACLILRAVARSATVVALDCVELAPRPGLHMAEFAAAKLLYKTLSWIMKGR